ncbi:hypothetical protein CCAX7_65630 [Capsulimonas corticalis]|uniref:Uncharacterized protein n=1 Tax=Capsulimonas corticalis TaxID=2219043 RepID=A0A402CR71_9BACT|nr:hypothetical protein [Capsulimonas corticalis]BDI34512.1 hypothetical protein CCAX7_65630 [Capsulimonas corticalis]
MATLQQPQIQSGAISSTLRQVKGRLRRERWIRQASLGALVGVGLSLMIVALDKFDLVPDWLMLEWFIPFAILVGVGVATITAFSQPISTMEAARMAEVRLGLKERFSSALEFERFGRQEIDADQAMLLRLQQQDALAHARGLRASDAAPFRLPWQTKALIAASLVLIAVILLPRFPGMTPPGLIAEREVVQKEGEKLEKRARLIEKQAEMQHLEGTRHVAQQMRKLGQVMARGHLDKQKALKRYSKLTQEMSDLQRKLQGPQASANGGGKSLSEAGRQLAEALSNPGAAGQNPQNPGDKQAGASSADKGKPGAKDGKAGNKSGDKNASKNFNVPGAQNGQSAEAAAAQAAKSLQTPEMKKAAEGLKQGDSKSLSEQLRQLAKRTESGQMSPQDREAAANDMQKLSNALQGTPLTETQKHAQAAADALREGNQQKAASEMRQAADSAEKEGQKQKDANAMQHAQNALRKSQGEMARSSSASEVDNSQSSDQAGDSSDSESDSSGDPNGQMGGNSSAQQQAMDRMASGQGYGKGKGQGKQPGQGQGQSSEPGYENGGGSGSANKAGQGGKKQAGQGQQSSSQKAAKFEGEGRKFQSLDQSKLQRNTRIYLGKPGAGKEGIGRLGPLVKAAPGAGNSPGAQSKVPYYNYVAPAKQSAEKAMDNEDIPPAYKGDVRKYFDSLQGQ